MNIERTGCEKAAWRCLVAEDSDFDWVWINRLLAGMEDPIDFYRAKSLEDGLFMAAQSPFDVFLLDFDLRDGNALEMLRDVAEFSDFNEGTPVVLMSSCMPEDLLSDPLASNVEALIPKDQLTFETITAALRKSLRNKTKGQPTKDD